MAAEGEVKFGEALADAALDLVYERLLGPHQTGSPVLAATD